jgi:erythromycin esterase-like protein
MWRNMEVESFIAWLREHNTAVRDPARQAGFFGLDMYNLNGSVKAVLDYLDEVDPEAARVARERYGCSRSHAMKLSTSILRHIQVGKRRKAGSVEGRAGL